LKATYTHEEEKNIIASVLSSNASLKEKVDVFYNLIDTTRNDYWKIGYATGQQQQEQAITQARELGRMDATLEYLKEKLDAMEVY
jgi:hypothetical protein